MSFSTTQVHGLNGSLIAASTNIPITEWSGEDTNETKDGTTTANAGYKSEVPGLKQFTGTFKAIWDTQVNPYLFSILPGTIVSLVLHMTNGTYYTVPNAMLKSISVSSPVNDLVTYTVTFASCGSYTAPSGNS
jgi:hypothetical protein